MGLDMYLEATGKNHRRVMELASELAKEFEDFKVALFTSEPYNRIMKLPKMINGYYDFSKFTKEDRSLIAKFKMALIKKAHSLEGILRRDMSYAYLVKKDEDDPVHEIGY